MKPLHKASQHNRQLVGMRQWLTYTLWIERVARQMLSGQILSISIREGWDSFRTRCPEVGLCKARPEAVSQAKPGPNRPSQAGPCWRLHGGFGLARILEKPKPSRQAAAFQWAQIFIQTPTIRRWFFFSSNRNDFSLYGKCDNVTESNTNCNDDRLDSPR